MSLSRKSEQNVSALVTAVGGDTVAARLNMCLKHPHLKNKHLIPFIKFIQCLNYIFSKSGQGVNCNLTGQQRHLTAWQ